MECTVDDKSSSTGKKRCQIVGNSLPRLPTQLVSFFMSSCFRKITRRVFCSSARPFQTMHLSPPLRQRCRRWVAERGAHSRLCAGSLQLLQVQSRDSFTSLDCSLPTCPAGKKEHPRWWNFVRFLYTSSWERRSSLTCHIFWLGNHNNSPIHPRKISDTMASVPSLFHHCSITSISSLYDSHPNAEAVQAFLQPSNLSSF